MEKNGKMAINGFDNTHFENVIKTYCNKTIERINLNSYLQEESDNYVGKPAELLIIRNAIENAEDIYNELNNLEWDKKYYDVRRKAVLNKRARTNLCFGKNGQASNYENKKGTIVSYNNIPLFNKEKNKLINGLREDENFIECEGNNYNNVKKNGIGWHGDGERKKVAGMRYGESMSLCFNWFKDCKPIGKKFETILNSGDIYIMSEKATGNDWRKKKIIYTLRHSAGAEKYTTI
tara:strand:- start:285 stop:989 length:705 start_codon:yes stop_codon:yes gene_type:complete